MQLVLIHFTADWAEAICDPHRIQVAEAAQLLGATVKEWDIGEHAQEALAYGVLNVPAVAIEGKPDSLLIGARHAGELIERLEPTSQKRP